MRYLLTWLRWAAESVGYLMRPYDQLADARRWFWRPRTPHWALVVPDDVWGCCTLDEGHEGPCEWFCSWCSGTGECPDCDGTGDDGSGLDGTCMECGGGGACPMGCDEGSVIDDRV